VQEDHLEGQHRAQFQECTHHRRPVSVEKEEDEEWQLQVEKKQQQNQLDSNHHQ
jgi:hypothetical protein